MHEKYPADDEVTAFYALALLGTSHKGRDLSIYMRAAALVEQVYAKNPQHPGAAHYLIHSYDDPIHAPLGLRFADAYSKIAPAASHALHMPSHIYFALGMWDEAVAVNERSYQAADARVARKNLGVDDRGFHALLWAVYGYLQQGRQQEARGILTPDGSRRGQERIGSHAEPSRAGARGLGHRNAQVDRCRQIAGTSDGPGRRRRGGRSFRHRDSRRFVPATAPAPTTRSQAMAALAGEAPLERACRPRRSAVQPQTGPAVCRRRRRQAGAGRHGAATGGGAALHRGPSRRGAGARPSGRRGRRQPLVRIRSAGSREARARARRRDADGFAPPEGGDARVRGCAQARAEAGALAARPGSRRQSPLATRRPHSAAFGELRQIWRHADKTLPELKEIGALPPSSSRE